MGLGYSDKIPISKGLLMRLVKYLSSRKIIYRQLLVEELEQEMREIEED